MSEELKSSLSRERLIFLEALKLPTPEERAAFLDRACEGNANLRAAVESLLRHHKDDNFMAEPGGTVRLSTVTEKPGDTIGRYKLMEQIGEGGFGAVYVAEQREPVRRWVALKISKLGMDTRQVVARFEAERQALAMMDHPNIAKVLDGGATESGRPYFVMELVKGVKVTEYCDQNKLTTRQRLDLFMHICRAVQHAHQKGVIHRDIKPSNILVTLHDGVPVPKVIDFGIAKATQGHLTDKTIYTEFQQFMGTPAYMSPEQAEMSGVDIDTRSDLYSLGVLLYELLTGSPPFDGQELVAAGIDEMRRTIREKEPVRPSTRLGSLTNEDLTTTARRHGTEAPKLMHLVRGDLDWIVMKCLEKDRSRRYENASGLAADIERHLNNEPIIARPPSNGYRLQKMVRRHKLAFAAGAAVTASILIGLAVSSWLYLKERQARQTAATAEMKALSEAKIAKRNADDANAQRNRATTALANKAFLLAQDLVSRNKKAEAVARLTQSLSSNLATPATLARLTDLLTYSSWAVPVATIGKDQIFSARFSSDGKRIVTASSGNSNVYSSAQIWDAQTGQPLTSPMEHSDGIVFAQFTPDGNRILTYSYDHNPRVWNAKTGALLNEPLQRIELFKSNNAPIYVEFSVDGQRLLTASTDNFVQVWDVQTGRPLTKPIECRDPYHEDVNADLTRILTSQSNQTVRLWNTMTGQLLAELKHTDGVRFARFSPDETRIITASGHSAWLWDAQTGHLIQALRHKHWVYSAKFSPDGKRVVTASQDGTARIWDAKTGLPLTQPLQHDSQVDEARFTADGKRVITIDGNDMAQLWDLDTGSPILLGPAGNRDYKGWGNDVQIGPEGGCILVIDRNGAVQIWKIQNVPPIAEMLHRTNVVTETLSNAWWAWDVTQVNSAPAPLPVGDTVESAIFSPDRSRILAASDDDRIRIWDAQSGALEMDEAMRNPYFSSYAERARFSKDGRRVLIDFEGRADNSTSSVNHETGRVFDVPPASEPFPAWLLPLAEAISGQVVDSQDQMKPTSLNRSETIGKIRQRLNLQTASDDWTVWGRWLLANPATRTISPFSKTKTTDWIKREMEDYSQQSLDEVERYAISVNNERLLQRIDKSRLHPLYRLKQVIQSASDRRVEEAASTLRDLAAEFGADEINKWCRPAYFERERFDDLNDAGYRLATASDANLRDGTFAVFCATQAVAKTGRRDPNVLDTLAAAYAEADQFDKAVTTQKEAIALLTEDAEKQNYGSRLKLYEAKTPYHQPANALLQ